MKISEPPVIVSIESNASPPKAWVALTVPEEMRQWYFENIPDFSPELGFTTNFPVRSGERMFTHIWEVVEIIPMKKIRYGWKYEEYPGDSFVTFEIDNAPSGISVTVSTDVIEDFPSDIPEFKRESCLGGWNYFMGRLKTYLEK